MSELLNELDIMHPIAIVARLGCAVLAGFLIGYERERHNQPAGLRTHMALALGASMIMIISILLPTEFVRKGFLGDPARLAAQVISGIGFLGAGAILRLGFNVKGLTTAASIWTTSGIGLAFGAGYFFLGAVSVIFLLIILFVFDKLEDFLIEKRQLRILKISFESKDVSSSKIIGIVRSFNIVISHTSIVDNIEIGTTELEISCRIDEDQDIGELLNSIKSLGHILKIRID